MSTVEAREPAHEQSTEAISAWLVRYLAKILDVPFCIAKYPDFDRCLLGRGGWLQKVRFGLVTYEDQLFLGRYGE